MITNPTPEGDILSDRLIQFRESIKSKSEGLDDIVIDIISLGPWSPSKEKLLSKCSFQFFLKYVLKIKIPPEIGGRSDSESADVGTSAHRVLEHVMLGKSVTEAFGLAKKEFVLEKKALSDTQWSDKVSPLEYSILSFQNRMHDFGRSNPVRRVLTELSIGMTYDRKPTGFFSKDVWYRGIVDLILMLDNGDILILDHKTGGGQGTIKPYVSQLDTYKILFHHGVNEIEGAQSGVHFIAAGDIKMGDYSPRKEIETKLIDRLEWGLEGTIHSLKETGYFKHVRGPHCKWCDYDSIGCKSGDLKPIEMGTKRFFEIKQI